MVMVAPDKHERNNCQKCGQQSILQVAQTVLTFNIVGQTLFATIPRRETGMVIGQQACFVVSIRKSLITCLR